MRLRASHLMLLLAGGPIAAAAQENPQTAHDRNDCRLAAQVLETGHPAPHYVWATEAISRCRDAGGSALAAVWARPPLDSLTLERIYFASYTLRDARISRAAMIAAQDPGVPQLVRLNAIRTLTSHVEPGFLLYSLAQLTPMENDSNRVILGKVSHAMVVEGTHPIDTPTEERILKTLGELRRDRDSRIARAASYVFRQLCRTRNCGV